MSWMRLTHLLPCDPNTWKYTKWHDQQRRQLFVEQLIPKLSARLNTYSSTKCAKTHPHVIEEHCTAQWHATVSKTNARWTRVASRFSKKYWTQTKCTPSTSTAFLQTSKFYKFLHLLLLLTINKYNACFHQTVPLPTTSSGRRTWLWSK